MFHRDSPPVDDFAPESIRTDTRLSEIWVEDQQDSMADESSSAQTKPKQPKHIVQAGDYRWCSENEPKPSEHRAHIEPWLSALLQAEHLNLLVGAGFTTAVANAAGARTIDFSPVSFDAGCAEAVTEAAKSSAQRLGRGSPNFEDQVRTVIELIAGLRVLASGTDTGEAHQNRRRVSTSLIEEWSSELDKSLSDMLKSILATERGIDKALTHKRKRSRKLRRLFWGFLLPFASRPATRERTHIFTTNYDRLIEYSCDLLGLRIVDRFVGTLAPVFHSSRLGVDLHYNPPGIRGEPRYLEGVIRLTKLHGSVDWRSANGPSSRPEVQRTSLPFGSPDDHPSLPAPVSEQLLIYPNSAKDVETLEFPYADLFRDFAAAVCRPNTVLFTYGFGFGDDHVNRVLRDALTIPSTHIVIISFDQAGGRLQAFLDSVGRSAQITLLCGPHFGDLSTLVTHYFPQPAIDSTIWRMVDLLKRRTQPMTDGRKLDPDNDKADDALREGPE